MKFINKQKMLEVIHIEEKEDSARNPLSYLRIAFSVLLLSLVFIQGGCKKEDCDNPRNPECSNFDACIDAVETSADFGFYFQYFHDGLTYYFPYYDTVFVTSPFGGRVWMKANSSKMSNYEWTVGSDSRVFKDSIINLSFDNLVPDYQLLVNLKVDNNKLSTNCYPFDTGTSEVVKKLVFKRIYFGPYPITNEVLDSINETSIPIFGKFHGSFTDNLSDTCTVEVFTNEFRDMEVRSLCQDNPLGLRNEVHSNNQYGFHRGIHQITYEPNYTSIGIIDKDDGDKLVIHITDNSTDDPPRIWEGRRLR